MDIEDQDVKLIAQQISEPIQLQVVDEAFKQKNQKGLVKVFRCQYCKTEYKVHRTRAINHKKTCRKRRQFKRINHRIGYDQECFRAELEHMNEQQLKINSKQTGNKQISQLKSELDIIKGQMNIMMNRSGQNYFENEKIAEVVVEQVWKDVSPIVVPLMLQKLKTQITGALQNKMQLKPMIASLRSNLISRFYQFDLKDVLQSWTHKLEESCKELLDKNLQKAPETRSRDKTAAEELKKYSQYQLTISHRRFIEDLKACSIYKRTTIIRFYNKLLKSYPALKLKVLPSNLNIYMFSMQRKIMDLQTIKRRVIQLWNEGRYLLACDIYFCVCLGLRRTELQKIYISNKLNQPYRFIKVFQNKNKNQTMRPIPIILHLLSQLSHAQYPITPDRFSQTSQFYGLRHVCITNLVAALLTQSDLAIHRRTQTTITRYLKMDTVELVDRAFNIQQFQSKMQIFSFKTAKQYPFFRGDGTVLMQQLKDKEQICLLQDNDEDFITDDNNDSILSNSIVKDYRNSNILSQADKKQIELKNKVYGAYNQQLQNQNYSPVDVVNRIVSQSNLSCQQINDNQNSLIELPTLQAKLGIISEMLRLKIDTVSNEQNISVNSKIKMQQVQSNEVLVVGKIGSKFYLSQSISQIHDKNYQERKLRPRKKQFQADYLLSSGDAYCIKCLKFFDSYRRGSQCFLKCSFCKFTTQRYQSLPIQSFEYKQQILITCLGGPSFSRIQHISIKKTSKLNNIMSSIVRDFGGNTFSNQMKYSSQVPDMLTSMTCHSKKTSREIEYNRKYQQYLPLKIQKSKIEGVGFGVFALEDIPAQTIILTYCGVIRTHKSLNPTNDSLFQIGFADPSSEALEPLALFFQPIKSINGGRYINHNDDTILQNSACSMGLIIDQNGKCDICLYIYATRQIVQGEEIFYDYGKHYKCSLFQPGQE